MASANHSQEPFGNTAQRLLDERGWSQRKLAEESGVNLAQLNYALTGKQLPTTERGWINLIFPIARALRVDPYHFAEYRLAVAREQLDPARVGLVRALRNLGEDAN